MYFASATSTVDCSRSARTESLTRCRNWSDDCIAASSPRDPTGRAHSAWLSDHMHRRGTGQGRCSAQGRGPVALDEPAVELREYRLLPRVMAARRVARMQPGLYRRVRRQVLVVEQRDSRYGR